jgi:hypothetical protein
MGHYYAEMFPDEGYKDHIDIHYIPPGQGKRPNIKDFMGWYEGECKDVRDQKAKCIGVKMK